MSENLLKKSYMNHFGVDLKSSDITRQDQYASNIKNAQYRKSGSIEKRKGWGKILNDARIIELKRTGKTGIAFTGKHNVPFFEKVISMES